MEAIKIIPNCHGMKPMSKAIKQDNRRHSILTKIKDLLQRRPVCKKCKTLMDKKGFPKEEVDFGMYQFYVCPKCDKEKVKK